MALQVPSIQSSVGALNKILKEGSASERREAIINHIQKTENDSRFDIPVNFPPNCSWFNTSDSQTLSFSADLKGKLVILDFFTYCCINCIHILPDLHRLEQEYQDKGVTIIGVHSAKFPNERNSTNILNAILRYGITHPVINDADIKLWDDLGISCWPTLLIVSPEGRVLYQIIGEGHYMELESFVQVAVEYYELKGSLSDVPLGLTLERDKCSRSFLSFPGKIAANPSTRDMYISDSSNHRVLVVDRSTGLVKRVYGSGSPGLLDGRGQKAEFNSPQGLVFSDGLLYVADTENHSIRQIDLCSHEVLTVVGTGVQGDDKVGGKIGKEQEISSPWDLCFNHDSSILYIAMAGTHQIWAYLLKDMEFLKNNYNQYTVIRMCGSGEEANRNNSFPHKAALAQPSGIDINSDGTGLYVADSESSTIRCVSTVNGSVKGVVGGALDPMDLFAFGDVDGKGRDVRLQHPLAVSWDSKRQLIYIADSYNHKIKSLNPTTKTCTTLAGNGFPGSTNGGSDTAQFNEPGGLCIVDEGDTLLIADTNNHSIRSIDLNTSTVNEVNLFIPEVEETVDCPNDGYSPLVGLKTKLIDFERVTLHSKGNITVSLVVQLTDGLKLNHDQPSYYQSVPDASGVFTKGIFHANQPISFNIQPPVESGEMIFKVELLIYYCSQLDDTCLMKQVVLSQPIELSHSATSLTHNISYLIKE